MAKSQSLLEELLLRYMIFVLRLLMEIHLTLHRRTHKHNIASVDQGGIRTTFGCDELVCTACKFIEHKHTCNYSHDIALVDQGGFRPTFGSVLACV